MRRRAFNPSLPSEQQIKNNSKSTALSSSLFSPFSFIKNGKDKDANTLILLLLSTGILLWIFVCIHMHLQLSVTPTPLGKRLRSRFMTHHDAHPFTTNNYVNKHEPSKEGLSACLLVNDENPRLPEWIAYHYQILPLRSLIVAVDPASRSSPADILGRWNTTVNDMGFDILQIWEEGRYMPFGGDGACDASDPHTDCLKHHRKRQQHFVRACMAEFKRHKKTWVLLTDVDEYITFNTLHPDDDPPVPLDFAPPGAHTLSNWTWHVTGFVKDGVQVDETQIKGVISGLPKEGWHGKMNGQDKTTLPLVDGKDAIFYGAYGSVFTDKAGNMWFLRDDFAWRDALDMPLEDVPKNVPIIRNSWLRGGSLRGTVDGQPIEIRTNWRDPSDSQVRRLLMPTTPAEIETLHGGHMLKDAYGKQYYVVRKKMLWPPHLSAKQLTEIRRRLPTVADGTTVMDVLRREVRVLGEEYADETIGPCLCMPRLLYGSREEDRDDPGWKSLAPEGFDELDFVTLRYRWHSLPDNRVNKYQKAIIDVSRISEKNLRGEAVSIHSPVRYWCRDKQPPRYATSFFRVNHYLDSFEAYSYRNDARADKRNCKKCYDEKGTEAIKKMDDDIRPWLKAFVDSVGEEKARALLEGAGDLCIFPDPLVTGRLVVARGLWVGDWRKSYHNP